MPPTPSIDPAILHAAAMGDADAFERVVSAFEAPIFRHVYRFVRHRQDAEDLTQEIFVKAYTHLRSFDTSKKFAPWLYTIATRTVYDWLRKKRRSKELLVLDDEDIAPETIGESQTYVSLEAVHDINAALERVKPIYKTALMLFYKDGFHYDEIADILGVPINTVKTYIYRGKKDLKRILEQSSYGNT